MKKLLLAIALLSTIAIQAQDTTIQATFNWSQKTYFLFPKHVTIYSNKTNKVLESKSIRIVFEDLPFEQIDGAVCYASKGKAYFFSGDQYIRVDMFSRRMDPGYPKPINEWGEILKTTDTKIEATFNWDEKTYFLSSKEVTIYDNKTNEALDSKPLSTVFGDLPFEQIDGAICYASKGKAYFFSGDQYIRVDMLSHKMDKGYPRPISEWGGVLKATTKAVKKVKSLKKGIQFFEGSWEETLALSKKTGKPIFVSIYTSGFHACRRIALNIFTDEKVADFYNKNFINVRIGDSTEDISMERRSAFTKTHRWKYVPTQMYINENNEELEVSDGCTSVYGLIYTGKEVLKKMD